MTDENKYEPHLDKPQGVVIGEGNATINIFQGGKDPVSPSQYQNAPSSIWFVPYRRNPFFTGRDELLILLHDQLTQTKTTALTQTQAISGLGGIGKTQTALEYAYRYRHEYRFVFWISAATVEALLADIVKLAAVLRLPENDASEQQRIVAAFKLWLTQQRDWLLILDNADDVVMISDYLPEGNETNGHVLLTTRAQSAGALARVLEVEKMGKDEGTLLLLRRANVLALDAKLDQAPLIAKAEAEAIGAVVDGLPLALDQAGAYIDEVGCNLSDYLRLYHTRRGDLMRRRGRLYPGHPETVATTWSLTFQQVEQVNPAAADLLRLCAFLAPDDIEEEIISEGASDLGKVLSSVAADVWLLNEAVEVLRRYSLVRRNRNTKTLSVHRLVQVVLIDGMNIRTQRLWAERAVRAVNRVFPSVEYTTWSHCERYLPHVQVCVELIDRYRLALPEASELLFLSGYYLQERARYEQAEPLYQRALSIDEKVFGFEHPEVATDLEAYSTLLRQMEGTEEAKLLEARAFFIRTKE